MLAALISCSASILIKSYQEYANSEELETKINISNKSYAEILETVQNNIKDYIKNGQFYHISNLFSIIFQNIFDQKKILSSFHSKLEPNDFYFEKNPTKVYELEDLNFKDGGKSTRKFSVNRNCNFYIQKAYDKSYPESVAKEIEYYNYDFPEKDEYLSKYPNLIIHSIKEEKKEESNLTSITIPYFPYQTLDSFIKNSENYLFTIVDKIVMIKEATLSLYLLHYNGKSHRNITSSLFFVNEKKDIYIGGFSHNRKEECTDTTLSSQVYYRNSNTENPTEIEEDIFSLGILTYEIMTANSPMNIFDKMSREKRLKKLKGKSEYINLLSDSYNKFVNNNKNIENELNDIFENIIKKCITNTKSDISIFKEIISNIDKLTLYSIFTTKKKLNIVSRMQLIHQNTNVHLHNLFIIYIKVIHFAKH